MLEKLFGKSKPKISPEEQKNIESKKHELNTITQIEKLRAQQEKNDAVIAALDKKNEADTKLAIAAKNAGQKDKALRYLAEIKSRKAQIVKYTNISTTLMRMIANLESSKDDSNLGKIMDDANKIVQKNLDSQDKFMDVLQDTAQINNDFDRNQNEVNDLLNQINAQHMDGLEDELKDLDNLAMLDAMKEADTKKVDQKVEQKDTNKAKAPEKKKDQFDDMISGLLN